MLIGLPVFDTSRIWVILAKITIFTLFLTYFYTHMDVFTNYLYQIVEHVKVLLGGITSIDLGCFMKGVGGVDFLNSLVNQFIFIATFVVSAVGTVLSYKMIIFFFSLIMKF